MGQPAQKVRLIAPNGAASDVFVHIPAVDRAALTGLSHNQKVSYELQDGRDGRQMAGEIQLTEG